MKRRRVSLSSWSADIDRDPIRIPTRPLSLRHQDYEDHYDFTTMFYDCFWDPAGDNIILLGPPLSNVTPSLDLVVLACPSMTPCSASLHHRFLGCQVVVTAPSGTTGLMLQSGTSEVFLAPQPNLGALFRNRRCITTLSRNNELIWIRDWVEFNREYHGCDAVLIYDNQSDAYGVEDIYESLGPLTDALDIVVLDWPFRYGAPDWRMELSYGLTESLYCQTGMLEHARHRFLSEARSVLNTDIDELVITEGDTSVFDLVENSATGLLLLDGVWVENHPPGEKREAGRLPRHKDFVCTNGVEPAGCERKWAVVPARVPPAAQWHIHRIFGMPPSVSWQDAEMRHFKAINTDWTVDRNRSDERRTSKSPIDPRELRVDIRLQSALNRVFPEEDSGGGLPANGTRRARPAYAWRDDAGRLAREQRWHEAIEAMQAARELMPGHPGFSLFLASLQEKQDDHGAASALRAEALSLRLRDPWYHLQCGRWLHDEGDLLAAGRCFTKAIEIDPTFSAAYHELACVGSCARDGGEFGNVEDVLRACARHVPDDHITQSLWAKELEGKGRFQEAITHSEAAIRLDPENPHYHCLHARLLRKVGRLEQAEHAVRQGMAVDDLSRRMQVFGRQSVVVGWRAQRWQSSLPTRLHAELAEILLARGDVAAAEAAAREALSVARTDPDRYQRLGAILRLRGCTEEAEQQLEASISLARQEMRRPTRRDEPLIYRRRRTELQAVRLCRLLRASGRAQAAIAAAREALAVAPASTSLTMELAGLLADRGEAEKAVDLLREAIVKRPTDPRLHHGLSTYVEAIDRAEAIRCAGVAVDLEPDRPLFREHVISLLAATGRYEEALIAVTSALPVHPHHAPFHVHLSRLLQRSHGPAAALPAARRAFALNPAKVKWCDHLAALLIEAGEDDEAEAVLDDALRRNGASGRLYWRLSRLLQRRHRLSEAVTSAQRAVAVDPASPAWREHLVSLLVTEGRLDEADAALREALARHPDDPALCLQRSRLLQRRDRPEEAVTAAQRAIAIGLPKPYPHQHLVALLIETGRTDQAWLALQEALDRFPDHAGLHYQESRLLRQEQGPAASLPAARQAVAGDPSRVSWCEHLVALLMDAGEDRAAEAALRAAFERKVESGRLYWHMSRLLRRRRRPEEALAAARHAVALDPEGAKWREHLQALLKAKGRLDEAEAGQAAHLDRPATVSRSRRTVPASTRLETMRHP